MRSERVGTVLGEVESGCEEKGGCRGGRSRVGVVSEVERETGRGPALALLETSTSL
jgi:hypothetical protein